jgi:hypothetical protein
MDGAVAVEVELKQTAADLRSEIESKRAKHYVYAHAGAQSSKFWSVPNFFFFLVPEDLESDAVSYASAEMSFAGVAVARGGGVLRVFRPHEVEVVRRARRLHDHPPPLTAIRAAMMRMSSEICGLRAAQEAREAGGGDSEAATAIAGLAAVYDPEDRLGDMERRGAELAGALGDDRPWPTLPIGERIGYCSAVARLAELPRSRREGVYAEVR